MRTQSIEVYTYDELDEAAKEKARNWFREGNECDSFWSECTIEDATTVFAFLGYDIKQIYWTGFWFQGDGACFEGSWAAENVKPGKLQEYAPRDEVLHRIAKAVEEFARKYPEASLTVNHSGHYYHRFCTGFTVSLGEACDGDGCEPTISQTEWSLAEAQIIELTRDCMQWIYRQLEKEYEYQNSDKSVAENIRANEYEFTKDGSRKVYL